MVFCNVSNILNCYGKKINEAALVLLSEALNGEYCVNDVIPFVGFSNDKYIDVINKLGYKINYVNNSFDFYKYLHKNVPVLLMKKSKILNHSYIYNEALNTNHYIIAVETSNQKILISDSYIQTIPLSTYEGEIVGDVISDQFDSGIAKGIAIVPKEWF